MSVIRSFLFQAGNGNRKYMGRVLDNREKEFSPSQKAALQKIIADFKPQPTLQSRHIIALQYHVISTLCADHSPLRKASDADGLREALFSFLSIRQVVTMRRLNRYFHEEASDICMLKLQRQLQTRAIAFSDLELYAKAFHCSSANVLRFQSETARELTSLDFSNSAVTRQELNALVPVCPKVSAINFSFCFRITNAAIFALPQNWSHLTSIDISGCCQLTDRAIVTLAARYPHLTSLSLLCCEKVSEASLRSLAEHCKELKKLNVSGCTKLKENSILNVINNCPALEQFDFDHHLQSEEVLMSIAHALPSLRLKEGHMQRAIRKLELFKSELSTPAGSPLGKLYQAVLRKSPLIEIENALRQLPLMVRNTIKEEIGDALENNKIVYRAVKRAILASFERLHPQAKASLNPKGNLVKLADDIDLLMI